MRFTDSVALRALPVITFGLTVDAFWRMPCLARSGLARIDPLVSYGSVAEHAHAIHGSSGFSETADTAALLAGQCTSCQVAQDKSAYWTPALYFQNTATGKFSLVNQVGGMLAYYLLYPNSGSQNVTAFPEGFSMISGDTNQRNFSYPVPDIPKSNWNVAPYNTQSFLRQAALGFNCLDYSKTPEGSLYRHYLPDKSYLDANCKDGIRFELMFPSCWNGKDKTSKDRKSHVAFPSQVMTGDCPDGFPVRLPSLFYEIIWDTAAFAGTAGQFVLANGDPTGYGFHGDFITGWSEAFLQKAANQCTNLSGKIEDCSLFTIQDSATYSNCNISTPSVLAKENVVGGMTSLPGNVPIVAGPGYASGAAAGGPSTNLGATSAATSQAMPTLSYSAGTSASSAQYVPGAIFAAKSDGTFSSTPVAAPSTTLVSMAAAAAVTSAPSLSDAKSFYSTQYATEGNTVKEVLWVEELVTVTQQETSTVTVTADANQRKRHIHQHRRRGLR
ncbi:hypothetical protein BGZ60DRAFT_384562 [Tricladium varicosporioides]|nr:hypothetical protein BGZ60DRAFT_384562 [Hymenoscyphus varicosporioides]